MTFTYSYSIDSLKVKDEVNADGVTLPRAVYQTYWTITGTNSAGQSASWSGATPFTAANVPEGSFTAFADLTEAEVIGWVQAVIDADPQYKAHIDERLEQSIEEEHGTMEDVAAEALPWATPAEDSEDDAGANTDPDPAD